MSARVHQVLFTNLMPRGSTAVVGEIPGAARLLAAAMLLVTGVRGRMTRRRRRAALSRS